MSVETMDQPEPMDEIQVMAWEARVENDALDADLQPLTWQEIKNGAQTEWEAYRAKRLTILARKSASELIPSLSDHAEMNALLDTPNITTAEHDLLVMTAGRSPLSVMLDN